MLIVQSIGTGRVFRFEWIYNPSPHTSPWRTNGLFYSHRTPILLGLLMDFPTGVLTTKSFLSIRVMGSFPWSLNFWFPWFTYQKFGITRIKWIIQPVLDLRTGVRVSRTHDRSGSLDVKLFVQSLISRLPRTVVVSSVLSLSFTRPFSYSSPKLSFLTSYSSTCLP